VAVQPHTLPGKHCVFSGHSCALRQPLLQDHTTITDRKSGNNWRISRLRFKYLKTRHIQTAA